MEADGDAPGAIATVGNAGAGGAAGAPEPEYLTPAEITVMLEDEVLFMQFIKNTLEDTMRRKEVRRARYEAFAMGQLERLGAGSRVRGLDPGVVGMVLEQLSKLDKSPQVPTFNSPPSCPQQVPGYPGLWPNGDAGCFHPAALNAIYIVSRDGFSLPTNNHGSFWRLNPSSKRCEMGTGVPGLRMLFCVCRPRIAQNLLMFATPFVPFKFRVEGLPEGLYLVCNMRPRRMQRRPEGHA